MKRLSLVAVLALTACGGATPPESSATPAHVRTHPSAGARRAHASDAPGSEATAEPDAPAATPRTIAAPSDVAAAPADAVKTASGLASKVLQAGTGKDHPGPEDEVKVHYSGWTSRGKMFDSSVIRGEPISLGVGQVIPGWTEGLQLMVVGEKRRLWIPADLAYGDHPRGEAPAGPLTFDVELLDLTPAPKPPPTPKDVKAPPKDAKRKPSGLAYRVLKKGPGKGPSPQGKSKVTVHYTGWTIDGQMFDSSVVRGEPTSFGVTQVIAGWTEALKLMVVGEKRRMWIPAKIAYGETARPGYPAGQLTFDVELLEITAPPKPPEVPKDVAAPPADAKKTASGLAYRVVKKGTGKEHPTATSKVRVHYSGWTKDGKMFDSSVVRGEPTSFGLNQVIPGWTEGVQLMVVGEKTRFWIPGKLAYGDEPKRPGSPSGQLTFDVELIAIEQ